MQLRLDPNRGFPKPHPIRAPINVEDVDYNFDLLYRFLASVKAILDDLLPASRGGTGMGSYLQGDMIVANDVDRLGTINAAAVGNALISQGVLTEPVWGKINLIDPGAHVTGLTAKGDLLVFDGTSYSILPRGTDAQVLQSSSSAALGLEWTTASGGSGDIDTILTDGDLVMLDDDGNVLYSG